MGLLRYAIYDRIKALSSDKAKWVEIGNLFEKSYWSRTPAERHVTAYGICQVMYHVGLDKRAFAKLMRKRHDHYWMPPRYDAPMSLLWETRRNDCIRAGLCYHMASLSKKDIAELSSK